MQIGNYRFDRMETAGSLGDLGTLLPLAMGMILVNGLSPDGLFFSVGLFYIVAGWFYRVPVAVQPMKVVGAYAVATGIAASQIQAAALLMALILAGIALSGAMDFIVRHVRKPVIRGVQLATGTLLAAQGLRLIAGTSLFQESRGAAEPFLALQSIGPIPVGLALGVIFAALTLRLLDSRRLPAALAVVGGGLLVGGVLAAESSSTGGGPSLPSLLPFGLPVWADFGAAFIAMVLPQTPMTIGNAVIANADLSNQYFPEGERRVTPKNLCLSMAGANILAFLLGGMPMCHGAGGLAAHYRFGARTAGSNLIIGMLFLGLAVFLGPGVLDAVHLLPLAVLGVLLVFAGVQLALTILDIDSRSDMFIPMVMLAATLAANLAWAFLLGLALSFALGRGRLNV